MEVHNECEIFKILNENSGDDTQVTELLEKIEEMVAANSGYYFKKDRKILQEMEERKRAKQRRMEVQKLREFSRAVMVSGEEDSHIWSLGSFLSSSFQSHPGSAYVSVRSTVSSNSSGYGSLASESDYSETSGSMEEPPAMSEMESSDLWSLRSSSYGSIRSEWRSTSSSLHGSACSSVRSTKPGSGSSLKIPEFTIQIPVHNSKSNGKDTIAKMFKVFREKFRKKDDLREETVNEMDGQVTTMYRRGRKPVLLLSS